MSNARETASDAGGFGSGFKDAFTWSNVGKQIGNGLISGAAGFVVSSLLERLFSDGESVEDMMQRFADEIVGRLTTAMRSIVDEAFFTFSLQRVKSSTASLGGKYVAFEKTQDVPLLDAAVNHSFDAVEDAISLGPPGLGTLVVAGGLKLCLLEEKAKTNNKFHDVALDEVERLSVVVENFVAELLAANDRAVSQFYSCKKLPPGEEGEFCFIKVDGVVEHHHTFDKQQDRRRIVNRLNNRTRQEIIDPALEIVEIWKRLKSPVLGPAPVD
jgi:hypothetical protein